MSAAQTRAFRMHVQTHEPQVSYSKCSARAVIVAVVVLGLGTAAGRGDDTPPKAKPDAAKLQAAKDHCDRGRRYYRKLEYDKAIAELTEAIRLDPTDAYCRKNRGIVYRAKGELDRAISDLSEAIRLRPDYAAALVDRGMAFAAKREDDQAIADYTKAIKIKPNYALAYEKRSQAYATVLSATSYRCG